MFISANEKRQARQQLDMSTTEKRSIGRSLRLASVL